jgi:hypothetical protein
VVKIRCSFKVRVLLGFARFWVSISSRSMTMACVGLGLWLGLVLELGIV